MVRITARQQFDRLTQRRVGKPKGKQFHKMSSMGIEYKPPPSMRMPMTGKIPLAKSINPSIVQARENQIDEIFPGTSNVNRSKPVRAKQNVINNRKITEFFSVMSKSPSLSEPKITPICRPGRRSQEFHKYHDDMTPKLSYPSRHWQDSSMIDKSRVDITRGYDSDEDEADCDVVIIEHLPPIPLRDHPIHEIDDQED